MSAKAPRQKEEVASGHGHGHGDVREENDLEDHDSDEDAESREAEANEARAFRTRVLQQSRNLRELIALNGISTENFINNAESYTHLDIFLTASVDLEGVAHFPRLESLSAIGNPNIVGLAALMACDHLKFLRVDECGLTGTDGLEMCTKLQTLHLSGNSIYSFDCSEDMTQLQVLWMADNHLTSLAGMEHLVNLTTLWVPGNAITRIGQSLSENRQLTHLNLAANKLDSFGDILDLAKLGSLRDLALEDPHFGANPVCHVSNYETYALYHLTQLDRLDTRHITTEGRQAAQAMFMKKRMYYNMRSKAIKRNSALMLCRCEQVLRDKVRHINVTLKLLVQEQLDLEYQAQRMQGKLFVLHTQDNDQSVAETNKSESRGSGIGGARTASDDEVDSPGAADRHQAVLATSSANAVGFHGGASGAFVMDNETNVEAEALHGKYRCVCHLLRKFESHIACLRGLVHVYKRSFNDLSAFQVRKLMTEFHTGGNVRVEDAAPTTTRIQQRGSVGRDDVENEGANDGVAMAGRSCDRSVRVVKQSFSSELFSAHAGIAGLRVNSVARVHNRFLRERFEASVDKFLCAASHSAQQMQAAHTQGAPPPCVSPVSVGSFATYTGQNATPGAADREAGNRGGMHQQRQTVPDDMVQHLLFVGDPSLLLSIVERGFQICLERIAIDLNEGNASTTAPIDKRSEQQRHSRHTTRPFVCLHTSMAAADLDRVAQVAASDLQSQTADPDTLKVHALVVKAFTAGCQPCGTDGSDTSSQEQASRASSSPSSSEHGSSSKQHSRGRAGPMTPSPATSDTEEDERPHCDFRACVPKTMRGKKPLKQWRFYDAAYLLPEALIEAEYIPMGSDVEADEDACEREITDYVKVLVANQLHHVADARARDRSRHNQHGASSGEAAAVAPSATGSSAQKRDTAMEATGTANGSARATKRLGQKQQRNSMMGIGSGGHGTSSSSRRQQQQRSGAERDRVGSKKGTAFSALTANDSPHETPVYRAGHTGAATTIEAQVATKDALRAAVSELRPFVLKYFEFVRRLEALCVLHNEATNLRLMEVMKMQPQQLAIKAPLRTLNPTSLSCAVDAERRKEQGTQGNRCTSEGTKGAAHTGPSLTSPRLALSPAAMRLSVDLSCLVYANLSGRAIRAVEPLSVCTQLATLVLSCNELVDVSALSGLSQLQELDIAYNGIRSLSNVSRLPALLVLDARHNLFVDLHDVDALGKSAPGLRCLDLRQNPFCESKSYRTRVRDQLSGLTVFDGAPVSEFWRLGVDAVLSVDFVQRAFDRHRSRRQRKRDRGRSRNRDGAATGADSEATSGAHGDGDSDDDVDGVVDDVNAPVDEDDDAGWSNCGPTGVSPSAQFGPRSGVGAAAGVGVMSTRSSWSTSRRMRGIALHGDTCGQQPEAGPRLVQLSSSSGGKNFNMSVSAEPKQLEVMFSPSHFASSVVHSDLVATAAATEATGTGSPSPSASSTASRAAVRFMSVAQTLRELDFSHYSLRAISDLHPLVALQRLVLDDNDLSSLRGVETLPRLRELSAEDNSIATLEGIEQATRLQRLELGNNALESLQNISRLTSLTQLSVEHNHISSLAGCEELHHLMELFVSHNRLEDTTGVLEPIQQLSRLIILDLTANALCERDEYRNFVLFNVRKLKVLDSVSVRSADLAEARQVFAGRITFERLAQHFGTASRSVWGAARKIEMTDCKLRDVSLLGTEKNLFPELVELKLCKNSIASFSALKSLPLLKVLDLSHNRIVTNTSGVSGVQPRIAVGNDGGRSRASHVLRKDAAMRVKQKQKRHRRRSSSNSSDALSDAGDSLDGSSTASDDADTDLVGHQASGSASTGSFSTTSMRHDLFGAERARKASWRQVEHDSPQPDIFVSLRVLNLAHNRITDLPSLRLATMPVLERLDLSHNQLSTCNGIAYCGRLRVLNLSHNSIRQLEARWFEGLASLRELDMSTNGLRSLVALPAIPLRKLKLTKNRVYDMNDLEKLAVLQALEELTVLDNPIARKQGCRAAIICLVPSISVIDEVAVLASEREQAEALDWGSNHVVGDGRLTNLILSPRAMRASSSTPALGLTGHADASGTVDEPHRHGSAVASSGGATQGGPSAADYESLSRLSNGSHESVSGQGPLLGGSWRGQGGGGSAGLSGKLSSSPSTPVFGAVLPYDGVADPQRGDMMMGAMHRMDLGMPNAGTGAVIASSAAGPYLLDASDPVQGNQQQTIHNLRLLQQQQHQQQQQLFQQYQHQQYQQQQQQQQPYQCQVPLEQEEGTRQFRLVQEQQYHELLPPDMLMPLLYPADGASREIEDESSGNSRHRSGSHSTEAMQSWMASHYGHHMALPANIQHQEQLLQHAAELYDVPFAGAQTYDDGLAGFTPSAARGGNQAQQTGLPRFDGVRHGSGGGDSQHETEATFLPPRSASRGGSGGGGGGGRSRSNSVSGNARERPSSRSGLPSLSKSGSRRRWESSQKVNHGSIMPARHSTLQRRKLAQVAAGTRPPQPQQKQKQQQQQQQQQQALGTSASTSRLSPSATSMPWAQAHQNGGNSGRSNPRISSSKSSTSFASSVAVRSSDPRHRQHQQPQQTSTHLRSSKSRGTYSSRRKRSVV